MSCTENESGPFVVFFLPAIVGGLTLLLARRWANSQTNSASSTAISRRRRIIKDPLVKRPQTFVNSKMLSQGTNSKKPISVPSKASCVLPGEEDNLLMAPGGRRLQRAARYSPAPIVSNTNAARTEPPAAYVNECPAAPKHIPFPNIPHDGDLLFEAMTFILTTVAAGLQFLNLYRTVWWLPHSHTSQAMNFYLIDPHVVAFIVIILSRRLLLCVCASILRSVTSPKYHPHAISALRMFVLGVVVGALAWCTYFITLKHPTINIFYLCYPATIYFLLFGAQVGPFLELGAHCRSRPPLHCCTSNPVSIRAEVEVLKLDFNMRMKKILFGSVMGAYYTGFIPCCFAQPYLYYDSYRATQHIALVWLGLFTGYAVQCYPAGYCDVLHRAALHLGGWTRLARPEGSDGADATDSIAGGSGVSWCSRTLWSEGARVLRPDGALFAARARVNAASPGDGSHYRFYAVFRNPSLLICCLLCLQLTLVLLQLTMLFGSVHWHHFLSISVLLFSNYYTLFKLVRDYLVSWKVYKAEYMIQDKSSTPVT